MNSADCYCAACDGIGSVVSDASPSAREFTCEDCDGAGYRQLTCEGCRAHLGVDEAQACTACRTETCRRCVCPCADDPELIVAEPGPNMRAAIEHARSLRDSNYEEAQ